MERKFRVYRYQNLVVPSASYIGKTCQSQSQRAGKNGSHYLRCPKFGAAIIEYGWPNFQYSVLADNLTAEEAEELERYYIQYYDSVNHGYNVSTGGRNGSGVYPSDETRKKMSESGLGKRKNRPDQSKRVLQYTLDGQFVKEYPSIMEAERQTGINSGNISSCCSGKHKSSGGSIWKYAS